MTLLVVCRAFHHVHIYVCVWFICFSDSFQSNNVPFRFKHIPSNLSNVFYSEFHFSPLYISPSISLSLSRYTFSFKYPLCLYKSYRWRRYLMKVYCTYRSSLHVAFSDNWIGNRPFSYSSLFFLTYNKYRSPLHTYR